MRTSAFFIFIIDDGWWFVNKCFGPFLTENHKNLAQIYKNVATVPLHKPKGMVYYKRILAELLPQMPR